MKTYFSIPFFILLMALGCMSCESFLDKEPVSSLSTQLFWKTTSDIESARAGMYRSFADAMRGNYFRWGELRSGTWEQCQHNGNGIEDLVSHHITDVNQADKWTDLYKTINKANLILKYVPEMTGNIDTDIAQKTIGEAYAMRALCYFYAVRVWGDVPLFREAVEEFDVSLMKERTDKDEILDYTLEDLASAETYLPSVSEDVEKCYLTLPAVYAIEMDVHAWRHNYGEVVKIWENSWSQLSGFSFTDFIPVSATDEGDIMKWRRIFMDGTTEHELVFSVKYDYSLDATENDTKSFFWHSGMQCLVTEQALNAFDQTKDIRFLGTFRPFYEEGETELSDLTPYRLEKFFEWEFCVGSTHREDKSDNDLIMYRYSDLMLLYAEALNEVGRSDEAVAFVNKTRQRAGLDALPLTLSKEQVADEVLKERHLELIGEGKYWFDLVRTGKTELAGCPENRILFPIHRDHLDQNPNLVQNKY